MKYSDFVKQTAARAGVSQSVAKATLDEAMKLLRGTVKSGEEVVLNGVGKFSKKVRSARVGINPATKERVEIPQTNTVTFKVAKEFKDSLNR